MLIIDGYNLLWSAHKKMDDGEISDSQLCRLVDKYLQLKSEKGQIIFDGVGPPDKSIFEGMTNLEVIFTGPDTDADTVIENKIATDSAPTRLTVVSSDRRIRKAGRTARANLIKSERFLGELMRSLNRKRKPPEPAEKRFGLDAAQTEQWLEFFDLIE